MDEKKVQPWADPKQVYPSFWSRSIGWYLMAAADTYELLHEETDCSLLKEILERHWLHYFHIKKKTAGHGIK